MSFELLQRVDLEFLHPALVNRVVEMLSACRVAGVEYWATSGYRTALEQQALYNQGRTRKRGEPIVTNARPFQSAHNFGLAIDFACDRDVTRAGLQPGWSPDEYEVLGAQARAHGLVWGGDLKLHDRPHVQIPGYVTAAELEPLRQIYLDATERGNSARGRELSKLRAVWDHLRIDTKV